MIPFVMVKPSKQSGCMPVNQGHAKGYKLTKKINPFFGGGGEKKLFFFFLSLFLFVGVFFSVCIKSGKPRPCLAVIAGMSLLLTLEAAESRASVSLIRIMHWISVYLDLHGPKSSGRVSQRLDQGREKVV